MKFKCLLVPVFIDCSFQLILACLLAKYIAGNTTINIRNQRAIKRHSVMDSRGKNVMPCAACKLLRRKCTTTCIFLPHFPPSEPQKFAAVHRIFGASNIAKMLQEIPISDRGDAVTSLVYEATARLQDPVYGCVSLISSLQKQLLHLQSELDESTAEKVAVKAQLSSALSMIVSSKTPLQLSPYGSGSYASDIMPLHLQATDSYEELENMPQNVNIDFASL